MSQTWPSNLEVQWQSCVLSTNHTSITGLDNGKAEIVQQFNPKNSGFNCCRVLQNCY